MSAVRVKKFCTRISSVGLGGKSATSGCAIDDRRSLRSEKKIVVSVCIVTKLPTLSGSSAFRGLIRRRIPSERDPDITIPIGFLMLMPQ